MLYHEREGKKKENANFVHIVYLLAKLCNIFNEAFFIDVSICVYNSYEHRIISCSGFCRHSELEPTEPLRSLYNRRTIFCPQIIVQKRAGYRTTIAGVSIR